MIDLFKNKNKILSLLLAALMLIGTLPINVQAGEPTTGTQGT